MMMRKIFTLILSALFVAGVFAQRPEAVIMKASVAPLIDAEIDEVWSEANVYPIDKPFQAEVPTVDGTTWKALWAEEGIYVLVECLDDEWLPMYLDGGTLDHDYDKAEIYFDVNHILNDGKGPSVTGGHYMLTPAPELDQNDGRALTTTFQGSPEIEATYSITVSEPNANYEYFIPMEALVDGEGIVVDLTKTIGFDVTMNDRDSGDTARKRAVWANIGEVDESWDNMDDCGYVTFDGGVARTYVESISIENAVIDENNGMVQIVATVLPEEATNKTLNWTVVSGTGKAKLNKDGVITGMMDGTVIVTAETTDGSNMNDVCMVTISNQVVTMPEINLIRNGYMKELNDNGSAAEWSGGSVVEGAMRLDPAPNGINYWDYSLTQQTFGCNSTDPYTFSFVLWAEESDTVNVGFEDPSNDYNRYGSSSHELSNGGESDWTFESELVPTKYVFDVVFNEKVENTRESALFMVGLHDPVLYIDDVELVLNSDLELLTADYIAVESIIVSGESNVFVDGTSKMWAGVLPADALFPDVKWSVVNGTGEATIDASGLLAGVAAGDVTVIASAMDDSEVTGVKEVTVVGVTGISQKSVNTLKVYPNPAVNELNVVLNSENTTVSIYNGVGQKMDEAVVSGSEYKFDISSYAAGIYFVRTGTSIAKFVK